MIANERLLRYWGKTDRTPESTAWHPALCHMIDVGAVAELIVCDYSAPALRRVLAAPLGVSEDRVPAWLGFLCALHDLGKISPGFLRKVPWLYPVDSSLPENLAAETNHAYVSFGVLGSLFQQTGIPPKYGVDIARALGGHHGTFPNKGADEYAPVRGPWYDEQNSVYSILCELFGIEVSELKFQPKLFTSAWLMTLAGLTSVCDWLGSDQRFFPPIAGPTASPPKLDLKVYIQTARGKATRAVEAAGWNRWQDGGDAPSFDKLFGFPPREMQSLCAKHVQEASRPFLLLVEVPMGLGKTEAALYAAELASRKFGQAGLYYALPTQATSNQMLGRVKKFLETAHPEEQSVLQLLHGLAGLNETFEELKVQGNRQAALDNAGFEPNRIYSEPDQARIGHVVAREWFCGAKRGLLASNAVGTVDQALLSVLTTRHMFVRLYALANKTVILDEVHAYDAYMSTILDRLVAWLGALGSNVILLSATLPSARREQILQAFVGRKGVSMPHAPYPRVTSVSSEIKAEPIVMTAADCRTVSVRSCAGGLLGGLNLLAEKLADGGCAAWICNTVKSAQETFLALKADIRFSDADCILFHARFLVQDRLRLEKQVLERFGKDTPNRPKKAVVVATQVVEQSLDLDFDVMFSALAPVDLLLQRLGRLHRHEKRNAGRPARLKNPELYWLAPDLADDQPDFKSSSRVYQPYILWRTWIWLSDPARRQLSIPADMEAWIEAVYGSQAEAGEPAYATKWREEMEDERVGFRSQATNNILPKPGEDVFDKQNLLDDDEAAAQKLTRLGDPTVTLVCAHETASGLSLTPDGSEPFDPDAKPNLVMLRRLIECSVHVECWRWRQFEPVPSRPASWEDTALLRSCELARFTNCMLQQSRNVLELDRILGLSYRKLN